MCSVDHERSRQDWCLGLVNPTQSSKIIPMFHSFIPYYHPKP